MIPNTNLRSLTSQGVTEVRAFDISLDDTAHLMTILRDTMYSDKILAVLREYSANAWDAHQEVGKSDVPISVTLPTWNDASLSIRDFGPGLSPEDMYRVYIRYGASTKRDNDRSVGMLGIGSKSGFAYADSFGITSFHKGVKRIYSADLDKSNKGMLSLLHEEPCGDETGVLIQIAVQAKDFYTFQQRAEELFRYFRPQPNINIVLEKPPADVTPLKHGTIFGKTEDSRGWIATMGCTTYRLDLFQISNIASFLHGLYGALYFNIGEISINASREGLKYDDHTKEAIAKKLELLTEEYVRFALKQIEEDSSDNWQIRLKSQNLRLMKLPIPDSWNHVVEASAAIKGLVPATFNISQKKTLSTSLNVNEHTRLIIRDDSRALIGFGLSTNDYIVRRVDKTPWPEVEKDLTEFCEVARIVGIPILKTSEMTWNVVTKDSLGKLYNAKHQRKVFIFQPSSSGSYRSPFSDYWEQVDNHTPAEDEVAIQIDFFHAYNLELKVADEYDPGFFAHYESMEELASAFGRTMPKIHGYKRKSKREVIPNYAEWCLEFVKSLLTDRIKKELESLRWFYVLNLHSIKIEQESRKHLVSRLGEDHLILEIVNNHLRSRGLYMGTQGRTSHLNKRGAELKKLDTAVEAYRLENPVLEKVEELGRRYPLLKRLDELWGEDVEAWLHYINAVDVFENSKKGDTDESNSSSVHSDE